MTHVLIDVAGRVVRGEGCGRTLRTRFLIATSCVFLCHRSLTFRNWFEEPRRNYWWVTPKLLYYFVAVISGIRDSLSCTIIFGIQYYHAYELQKLDCNSRYFRPKICEAMTVSDGRTSRAQSTASRRATKAEYWRWKSGSSS